MKQPTKVLLPLGLFMSLVIPISVKSLFTETDFFESDETSKIDYLQPYQTKPEAVTDLPHFGIGRDGSVEVARERLSATEASTNIQERLSERSADKANPSSSISTPSQADLIEAVNTEASLNNAPSIN